MDKQILSVSQLNSLIKAQLESEPLFHNVCIRGELSNYKIYPSGHHYFTLKDEGGSLRCVMFRSSAQKLRYCPENGMAVLAYGRITVYERDGAYQLQVTELMPEGTGDLQIAFEQLKAKLSAEGLFDPAHKKPLPAMPERIAVITSSAGAAVHDMIRILGRRWPMTKVLLMPVRVQGVEAPAEIAGAIKYANEFKVADLIITGRGGGSIEDLWAFNDERVARAIYDSELPVISAVGHEPDVTISDYVADVRASTPSNAAEIAVPDCEEIRALLNKLSVISVQGMDAKLKNYRQRLENISSKAVITDPSAQINNRRQNLDYLCERLVSSQERFLAGRRRDFVSLAASLDAMSPLRVLSRGYAAAADSEGNIINQAGALKPGDRLTLRFSDGEAGCLVENLNLKKLR